MVIITNVLWCQVKFKERANRRFVGAGFTDNLSAKTGNLGKPALFLALLINARNLSRGGFSHIRVSPKR
ncbi:hypothetical protein [Coleofasciculus sp. G2-EDA-02]|uniref:hypothetical protein n=1 Tax=Coleofasciculus sp. G2-EDA-02 TaxID=3069529 RepID=UPI0032F60AF3